ncbi:MAG TPA: hypothetical protein DEO65_15615 [Bacillus bacterium]|nr:hypothetical protein [Bacillus sp. (in: firmicutes)]
MRLVGGSRSTQGSGVHVQKPSGSNRSQPAAVLSDQHRFPTFPRHCFYYDYNILHFVRFVNKKGASVLPQAGKQEDSFPARTLTAGAQSSLIL